MYKLKKSMRIANCVQTIFNYFRRNNNNQYLNKSQMVFKCYIHFYWQVIENKYAWNFYKILVDNGKNINSTKVVVVRSSIIKLYYEYV